jgi:hypothetical protein
VKTSFSRFVPLLVVALLFWPLSHSAASAQPTGTIRGQVQSSVTGEPLDGVEIELEESGVRTRTDEEGRFVLTEVPPGQARLSLELRSYVTTIESVAVGPGQTTRLTLEMTPVTVLLEELAVRATPETAGSNMTIRSYTGMDPAILAGKGTVVDLLSQDFPGVTVQRTSGQVGSSPSIVIRGIKSLTLSAEPVVYVDGVRMNTSAPPGEAGTRNVLQILESIPAEDVRRIEVLKGPAANRYGVTSTTGAIFIWTRRGG